MFVKSLFKSAFNACAEFITNKTAKYNKSMKKILLTLILALRGCSPAFAEVQVYPANQEVTHNIGKCDANGVKKTAHFLGSSDYHKKLDKELQLGVYEYCCETEYFDTGSIKNKKCDPQCVTSARLAEERQRQAGKTGITQGLGIAGGLLYSLIRGF